MSELLVLKHLVDLFSRSDTITVEETELILNDPVLFPFLSALGSIYEIIFRLNQENVLSARISGDTITVSKMNEGSHVHHLIKALVNLRENASSLEEFKGAIHASLDLNPFFMNDKEIEIVYHRLVMDGVQLPRSMQ